MSFRNGLVLLLALSTLMFLAACGSSSSSPTPEAPPSGGFSTSTLNGTYVFSVSGQDFNSYSYAAVGTFTANGSGGITGGAIDMNDAEFASQTTPVAALADSPISNNGFYTVSVDGRGQITLGVPANPFASGSNDHVVLDFVLQDSSHGLVTEFDGNATGSGTIDLQSSGITPSGPYSFLLAGGISGGFSPFATAGNFTVGSGGAITAGLEDFNTAGVVYSNSAAGYPVSGSVVAGPSSLPATVLSTGSPYGAITFDVYPISSTHLKLIETDTIGTLSGDAYSQTSATVPAGTLPFTLAGQLIGDVPFAAGGFMVTDSSGDITGSSTEDFNEGDETLSSPTAPAIFTGSYSGASGRFILDNLSGNGFIGGTEYVAYPSSAGLLLLEIDDSLGIEVGVAYPPQSSTATLAASEGYGLNLTGANLVGESEGETSGPQEVDDIAEFSTGTSGALIGIIDENYTDAGTPLYDLALSDGTFGSISTGRSGLSASANTLSGGFGLILYTVDGTSFPFMESDDAGQVSTGVVIEQNASLLSPAIAKSHLFVVPRIVQAHASVQHKSLKRN